MRLRILFTTEHLSLGIYHPFPPQVEQMTWAPPRSTTRKLGLALSVGSWALVSLLGGKTTRKGSHK